MYLLCTVKRADGCERNIKKNVLVCIPWRAEPKRKAWVQMVYLEGDSKSRHAEMGGMRPGRGTVNAEVHH